jgi:sec-independent protein translocase protein TatC
MSRDLFDEMSAEEDQMTRMTFGEHLEDLRRRIILALLCFVPGLAIALFLGGAIVRFMQDPAAKALRKYRAEMIDDKWQEFQKAVAANAQMNVERLNLRIPKQSLRDVLEELYPQLAANRPRPAATNSAGPGPASGSAPAAGSPTGAAPAGTSAADRAAETKATTEPQVPANGPTATTTPASEEAAVPDEPLTWIEKVLRFAGLTATKPNGHKPRLSTAAVPDDFVNLSCDVLRQELVLAAASTDEDDALISLDAQETLMTYLKASMVAGLVLSSPFVFYHLWAFIAEGLYRRERRAVYRSLPVAIGLFLLGVFFCFFLVLPFVVEVLLGFNRWIGIKPQLRLSQWMGFATLLPVLFGLCFQLPIVMVLLDKIGIFDVSDYRGKRRHAILAIAIFAMVITPTTDPGTMLLLMGPMWGLYELGILFVSWQGKGSAAVA